MFELDKSSLFFEQMSSEHPALVQNIEVIYENRIQLDVTYHEPKKFILELNNLLRSVLFLIEYSVKNSPNWLSSAVASFREGNSYDHEILKYLRNVSAHQKLILPDESLVSGLYRMKSQGNYLLKLGFGDHDKPGSYSKDFTLNNTDKIFHDLLVFSSLAFMDLEHSALGECLGVTRKWFFKVKFKTKKERFDETVDVHKLITVFSGKLLDCICEAYSREKGIAYSDSWQAESLGEHNCINTLLEIDIYPSLFSKWWEEKCTPLNFGVRVTTDAARRYELEDEYHTWANENLTENPDAYIEALRLFVDIKPEDIITQENFRNFCSIIGMNHWHYKKAFIHSFGEESPLDPVDIARLQRIGNMFIEESRKEKYCTIMGSKQQLDEQIENMINKIQAHSAEI